jgi:hypothetical protein
MRYALPVLLVLALSGCSMLGGNGDAGPTETVTPVPVTDVASDDGVTTETATPTPDRTDRPDGGAFADLLDDHARRVRNVSYAYRHTVTGLDEGTVPDRIVEGYRGRNASVYYRNRTVGGGSDQFWSNGTVYAAARATADGTEYSARRASGPRRGSWVDVDRFRQLFQYARPTAIDENESHYRIEGVLVRRNGETILGPDAGIENSSVSMTVTTGGLIESYRIEIHGEYADGERVDILERFSLDPSVDTLPRPPWVDRAIDSARQERFGNRIPGFGYVDEHEAALANTSYAYRFESRTDNPDVARAVRNETVRGYSGASEDVVLVERRVPDFETEDGMWSNGTITVRKHVDGNRTSYDLIEEPVPSVVQDIERLGSVLRFAEVSERRTNGTRELIEATLVERDGVSLFGPDVTIENSSLSLVVAEDGVIETYDLRATVVTDDGEQATITERFRLDRSADTLPRPDWVDRALTNETTG